MEIERAVISSTYNSDALKWLIIYPVGLATWMLKEGTKIIFPDDKMSKTLHEWKYYWQLKAHFNVGIFYAISLSALCVFVWATNNLTTGWGFSLFISCIIAISLDALSFYQAQVKVKEILIHDSP